LSDHLDWQLRMSAGDDILREIGQAIIGNIDDDGYLQASVDEICAMGNYKREDVEKALTLVQSFDPVGVAARDLRECLLIQIKHLEIDDTPVHTMVAEHLNLLQAHRFNEIAKAMGLPMDEVIHHCEIIRRLDPKPGSKYNQKKSQYVTPDVYVVKVEDKYEIVLNEDRLPQLRISSVYRRMLENKSADNEATRSYVKEKLRNALWLIKSVDQRQKTIYKVSESIVQQQKEFLDKGLEYLKPLVLRDVAVDIGMHESTVSRVVTNKYIHTPQGVFEMKYFFHSGIASTYGESVSSVTIKQRIKKIVEEENPKRPLSDSKIVKILEGEGLMLARRTIAKYREELRIPPSNQRKNLYTSPFAS
jgi:RNA polymerase sigma-54 factor